MIWQHDELKLATICNVPVYNALKTFQFPPVQPDKMVKHHHSNGRTSVLTADFVVQQNIICSVLKYERAKSQVARYTWISSKCETTNIKDVCAEGKAVKLAV